MFHQFISREHSIGGDGKIFVFNRHTKPLFNTSIYTSLLEHSFSRAFVFSVSIFFSTHKVHIGLYKCESNAVIFNNNNNKKMQNTRNGTECSCVCKCHILMVLNSSSSNNNSGGKANSIYIHYVDILEVWW